MLAGKKDARNLNKSLCRRWWWAAVLPSRQSPTILHKETRNFLPWLKQRLRGERESYSHSCVFHDMGRFHEKYISSKIQENWLFREQTGFSRVIFLLVCLHAQWSFSSSQIPPLHFNQLDIHIFLLKHHTFQTQNLPVWYRLCFLPPLLNYYNIGWFQTRSAEIWPG